MTIRFAGAGSRRLRCLLLLACLACLVCAAGARAQSRTYTLDGDFDEGTLTNLNHNTPNSDQLQLNIGTAAFPFINVAASSLGTMVRIDVNTGAVIGEFLTSPDGTSRNPSRTTVDRLGNTWITNRDESGHLCINGECRNWGSMSRYGLIVGGTRVNADGSANPSGPFLVGPFDYNTCIDRHGATLADPPDGLIQTSTGLGDVLPWGNAGSVDTDGGVQTALDECIINYTRTIATNTRTVAVTAANDIWVGGANTAHEKIDGVTGERVPGTDFNKGCGGYGGLIDGNGVLWSARYGSGLLRYDTNQPTSAAQCMGGGMGDYGLGVDPVSHHIWHTYHAGDSVCKINPDGTLVGCYAKGDYYAQGVAVDGAGNVWVAHSLYRASVGHLRTNGTYVGTINLAPLGGNGPTGVAVDANGKIWVANIYSHNVMRIDPAAGPIGGDGVTPVGAVDLTVALRPGAGPYNYSDMTGFVSVGTAPQGTWSVVYDGGALDVEWGTVSWTGSEPVGTGIGVEVRAANTLGGLPGVAYQPVGNGVDFSGTGIMGQYIQIRTTLTRDPSVSESPVLHDLTVAAHVTQVEPCASAAFHIDGFAATPDNREWVRLVSDDDVVIDLSGCFFNTATSRPERVGASIPLQGSVVPGGSFLLGSALVGSLGASAVAAVDQVIPNQTVPNTKAAISITTAALVPGSVPNIPPAILKAGISYYNQDRWFGVFPVSPGGGKTAGYAEMGDVAASLAAMDATMPDHYALEQNYPNPFNPQTLIRFSLEAEGAVTLVVYDGLGREVRRLVDGALEAGLHEVVWDGRDASGMTVASGAYFYRIEAGSFRAVRHMSLIR